MSSGTTLRTPASSEPGAGGRLPTFFNHPSGKASLFLWLNFRFHVDLVKLLPSVVPWFLNHAAPIPSIRLLLAFSLAGLIITISLVLLYNARLHANERVAFHNHVGPAGGTK